jgi:hypothetical protein
VIMHVQNTGWSQEYFLKIEGTYIINSEHRDGLYEMSDDAYEPEVKDLYRVSPRIHFIC